MTKILLIIGTGSFIGGILRYLLSRFVQNTVISTIPLGTLIVNIIGCFFIGMFYGLWDRGNITSIELRMFLTVGLCGGFTTFSSFTNENILLLKDGNFLYFSLYTGLSVFVGLTANYFGFIMTKLL